MILLTHERQWRGGETVVALGMFDGVHEGHSALLRKANELAALHDLTSVVYTFSSHPMATFAPDRVPPQLETRSEKVLAIAQLGTVGVDNGIMAAFCLLNMALTAADLVLLLRRRHTELGSRAWGCGITALLVGVAEPSVFGICLKDKTILRNVVIGCVAGGIFQGIVTVNSYVFSFPGLCAVLMFYSPERPENLTYALIAMAITFAVSFLLNLLTLKKEPAEAAL